LGGPESTGGGGGGRNHEENLPLRRWTLKKKGNGRASRREGALEKKKHFAALTPEGCLVTGKRRAADQEKRTI